MPTTHAGAGARLGWALWAWADTTMHARPDHCLDTDAQTTLPALFAQRVARTPDAPAYRFYAPKSERWIELSWRDAATRVAAWRSVLAAAGIRPGDRVAIMLRNSPEWLCVDQAVLSLGAATVGLFCNDTSGNNAALIDDSGARVLVAVKQDWIAPILEQSQCPALEHIFVFAGGDPNGKVGDARLRDAQTELAKQTDDDVAASAATPATLASLVYASGTSTQPRASMVSHRNFVWCAQATADALPTPENDHAVSYLPLAHGYERVVDAYRAMITGATITFTRKPRFLNLTLMRTGATSLVAAPRIYELFYLELHRRLARQPRVLRRLVAFTVSLGNAVFEYQQGRARRRLMFVLWPVLQASMARYFLRPLCGELEYAVCAGAALPQPVARTLIGLGLPVLQGYGLTEAGPMVSFNRLDDNDPNSVGRELDGVETRVDPDGELLVRSPGVMAGYWQDEAATAQVIDAAGWLHTGDKASRLDKEHLYLTGRIKEVIAMATGNKALPQPLEETLRGDTLVDNVIVVGEARPALAAVVSCAPELLGPVMHRMGLSIDTAADLANVELEKFYIKRFKALLTQFPAHAQIRHVAVTTEAWTRDNGLLDATGRVKRRAVARYYARAIARLFGQRADNEKTDASQNTNLG